jgi:hypothetical protein
LQTALPLTEISKKTGNFHPRNRRTVPSPQFPPPPANLEFGEFLEVCRKAGIRPPGKDCRVEWKEHKLAGAIGITMRMYGNYQRNEHVPRYPPTRVENALFGKEDPSLYLPDWRRELRASLQRTRAKNAATAKLKRQRERDTSLNLDAAPLDQNQQKLALPDSILPTKDKSLSRALHEHGPTIVGGVGIAQGVAHLIWLLTEYLSGNPENLWEKHWAYADLGFGIGGIIIGLGCIAVRPWARKSGICFCVAALFSAYLWFADESNADAERLLSATNVLNVPISIGALIYFLIGWPQKRLIE